jgi:hypothetical protein
MPANKISRVHLVQYFSERVVFTDEGAFEWELSGDRESYWLGDRTDPELATRVEAR